MTRNRSPVAVATTLAVTLGACVCSHGKAVSPDDPGEAPPMSAAKLTEAEATSIALAKVAGDVVASELERERGHLIYSIEIHPTGQAKGIKEVSVDAIDGAIVNVEDEDEDDDDDDDNHGETEAPARQPR